MIISENKIVFGSGFLTPVPIDFLCVEFFGSYFFLLLN